MQDLLRQLVSDTQLYLKDPLRPKGSLLATEEESLLLEQVKLVPREMPPKPVYPPPKRVFTEPIIQKTAEVIAPPAIKPVTLPQEDSVQIKETLSKLIPGMRFVDQIPDDSEGKKIGSSWKEKITDADVILLACKQDTETIEFLKVLAKAINTHLAKAKIIPAERLEKEGVWDIFLKKNTFRLIVASEGLEQLKGLMSFYRGSPTQNAHFLDQTPLLPLLSASVYKQLDKKAEAWKTLCQILKK